MTNQTIALSAGDANGIGPELVARLLLDPPTGLHFRLHSSETELRRGLAVIGSEDRFDALVSSDHLTLVTSAPDVEAQPGTPSAASGAWALANLSAMVKEVLAGESTAAVFAPLNKHSLHLAGMDALDELRWLEGQVPDAGFVSELNVGSVWTSRVTSHVALRDAPSLITPEGVAAAAELLAIYLRANGVSVPRIGVSALNPHCGEGGAFGDEEIRSIAPGVELARERGLDVTGPLPSDTIFLRARAGDFDGVVTMFHDQGQIAMKLMGFDGGVTVEGGLGIAVCTPAQGTAYDITGRGVASDKSLRNAVTLGAKLGRARALTLDRPDRH